MNKRLKEDRDMFKDAVALQQYIQQQADIINSHSQYQFSGSDTRCCSYFGCGKELTITEAMCGNRCLDHQNKIKKQLIISV